MAKIHQLHIMKIIKKDSKKAHKRYQIILKKAKEEKQQQYGSK